MSNKARLGDIFDRVLGNIYEFPAKTDFPAVDALGLGGRPVRLVGLMPQIRASQEQEYFLENWLRSQHPELAAEAQEQLKSEGGLWAYPVWNSAQHAVWLGFLANLMGLQDIESWSSKACLFNEMKDLSVKEKKDE